MNRGGRRYLNLWGYRPAATVQQAPSTTSTAKANMTLTIADKTILITGANRGIGRALVEEALNRGAKRGYAGTRKSITHPDGRVVPLILDVTKADDIERAAAQVGSVDVVINNAGLAMYDDLSDPEMLE